MSYSNVPGQGNSYAFNAEATYSCDTGFSLVDNNTRTCTGNGSSTNGSFDGEAPTCEGECIKIAKLCSNILYTVITCSPLSDPSNGTVAYNVESLEFGTQAIYSCDNGFSLVGNTTRTCTGDGTNTTGSFDEEAPTCEGEYPVNVLKYCMCLCDSRCTPSFHAAIVCHALRHPINGEIEYDGEDTSANNNRRQIPFGTMATYTCVKGFALIGNDIRTCTGDGSSTTGAFSGIDPTCERE